MKCAKCGKIIIGHSFIYWNFDYHLECLEKVKESERKEREQEK